jgi:hypothetical protein
LGSGVTVPPVNLIEGNFAVRGEPVRCQGIPLGGDETLWVFRTPGHTPDSISLRAGNILFLGDLIFAANPGFAGMPGWSQEDLIRSLDCTAILLEEGGIAVCCPGHGKPLTPAATRAILGRMASEARTLSGIAEVSPAWARETAAYAENLVVMVNELFTILSGRLYLVAHVLDELEESGEAERLKGIITSEAIDGIIADFHEFSEEYRQGKRLDFHLTLKAGQIIQRLHHAFDPATLATVVDASLLRRAERLLSDYMTRFRGFTIRPEMESVDLNGLIREVLENAGKSPWSGEAVIEAADSGERYLEALVSRIAHPPVFEDTCMAFNPGAGVPPVITDPERLSDLITGILEEFAGRGMAEVHLATSRKGQVVRLAIEAQGGRIDGFSHGEKVRFLREECQVLSCDLAVDASDDRAVLGITLPV